MDGLKELGETFGIWGTIVLFVIYAAQQIIRDLIKAKREKLEKKNLEDFKTYVYNHLEESKKTNEEIRKYLKISTLKYAEDINESQARVLIDCIFNVIREDIVAYLIKIRAENHITGNEREITAKIKAFISNRFDKDKLSFKEFKFKGVEMSSYLKEDWKDHLIEQALAIVLKEKSDGVLFSTMTNMFNGFKIEYMNEMF